MSFFQSLDTSFAIEIVRQGEKGGRDLDGIGSRSSFARAEPAWRTNHVDTMRSTRRAAISLPWLSLARPVRAETRVEEVQKRINAIQTKLGEVQDEERRLRLALDRAAAERSAAVAAEKGTLPKQKGVLELVPETWDETVGQNRRTFVELYAPWCPYCKRLEPTWEELAMQVEARDLDVQIARLNGDKHVQFMDRYRAEGFPTLILFQRGVVTGYYNGRADVESLLEYIA